MATPCAGERKKAPVLSQARGIPRGRSLYGWSGEPQSGARPTGPIGSATDGLHGRGDAEYSWVLIFCLQKGSRP